MNKLPLIFSLALLLACLAGLAACDVPPAAGEEAGQEAGQEAGEEAAPQYIWTVSIDGTQSRDYGQGQLAANYTVRLSASKEGGDTPQGEYRGEIRVDYQGLPDQATQLAIGLLGGSYDFSGWGECQDFAFNMAAYDHEQLMAFVADSYRGAGARSAPLLQGIAMYTATDIPWTDSDWAMGLDAGLDGVFGVDAFGDASGGAVSVYTPFGNDSAGGDAPVTLCYSLHFLDESRAQLNIWSHGDLDVELSFNGTLDKVLLADTVAVE